MTMIHPTATVEEGADIGEDTKIWHYVHVRTDSRIGKNCIVGKSAFIDTKVKIGDNCKIENFASIYQGVEIGNGVFVGPHVCFTNDMYPRAANKDWKIVNTVVEDGVSIGANATILCGITIGKCSMVAAGSVVTKDVPPNALVVGNPAKVVDRVCECGLPGSCSLKKEYEKEGICRDCGKPVSL